MAASPDVLRRPLPDDPPTDVLVLCYHGVSPTWPAVTAIRPDQLRAQIEALAAAGYVGATFSDALVAPPARRTVAITFDDAHRSVYELARPLMDELGFPGTVFVVTDFPDGDRPLSWDGVEEWIGGPHEHELACMSWDELADLRGAGWEIGSHTRSHPHLTELGPDRLAAELRDSKAELERRLGGACESLAYPYGQYDNAVARAAWDAGYRVAATVAPHYAAPLPLQWPRVAVGQHESDLRFRLRTAAVTRRLGVSPSWRPLLAGARAVKGAARGARGRRQDG